MRFMFEETRLALYPEAEQEKSVGSAAGGATKRTLERMPGDDY